MGKTRTMQTHIEQKCCITSFINVCKGALDTILKSPHTRSPLNGGHQA
jgi:hypothetical protein